MGKHSTKNDKEKNKKRSRNKKKKDSKIKLAILKILGILTTLVIAYVLKSNFWDKPEFKMHEVIRSMVNLANLTTQLHTKVSEDLTNDPISELIEKKLRPVQARLTSLRTQTSMYEKMEHINGGPTSFIKSSLTELNYIYDNELKRYNIENLLQSNSRTKASFRMMEKDKEHAAAVYAFLNKELITFLVVRNVTFIPLEDKFQIANETAASGKVTLEQGMNSLLKLADMYETLYSLEKDLLMHAKLELDLNTLNEVQNVLELENDDYVKVSNKLENLWDGFVLQAKQILEEQKNNVILYQVFWVLRSEIMNEIRIIVRKVQNNNFKRQTQINELQLMIVRDIDALKVRISNLQYKYIKQKVEF